MPFITAIFKQSAFDQDMTKAMGEAYEKLAADMGLTRQDDALTRRSAETIIEVARRGQRDPDKICADATALLMNANR
jgi:hypothetical protein